MFALQDASVVTEGMAGVSNVGELVGGYLCPEEFGVPIEGCDDG